MRSCSSRLLMRQQGAAALLPSVSRQARLATVAKAKQQQKGDKGGKKEGGGEGAPVVVVVVGLQLLLVQGCQCGLGSGVAKLPRSCVRLVCHW